MYSFFVGCDISKDYFDVAYHASKSSVYLGRFTNKVSGFKAMIKALKRQTKAQMSTWFICFENTGVYSKGLLEWLCSQQIPRIEENPLQINKSLGLRRGKNDVKDSKDICQYAYQRRDTITCSQLPDPVITQLKVLLSRRELLVKHKGALRVSLTEQSSLLSEQLLDTLMQSTQEVLIKIQEQIIWIEQQIETLIGQHKTMKTNRDLLRSVIGIGPIITAHMLVTTHNFSRFTDPRKFASYSGVAPFPNQSGKRNGKWKTSKMSNRKINALLSCAAIAASIHDPQIKAYFKKKIEQGKPKGCAYNNVKNKLIQRIFAVIKRKTPYVTFKH